jgi:hypothetical protein
MLAKIARRVTTAPAVTAIVVADANLARTAAIGKTATVSWASAPTPRRS